MQESLGYIDGDSMALIDSLVKAIEWQGGRIHVNSPVSKVTVAKWMRDRSIDQTVEKVTHRSDLLESADHAGEASQAKADAAPR
jgi:phytoene dehydrogenase-like protein